MADSPRADLALVASAAEWDACLRELDVAHFLQSSTWAGFKASYGWQPEFWRLCRGGLPMAYASVLSRCPAHIPLALAYVPRGPLLVERSESSLAAVLEGLERLARERRYLYLKVDPDIWDEEVSAWAGPLLRARGWQPGEQIQFRNTVTLDIEAPDDVLLARMKQKTRYNISLASRRGVTVEQASREDLRLLYGLYVETAVRDGFIVRPRSYYERLWASLLDADMAGAFLARQDSRLLAGLVAVAYGRTTWYFHGASADEGRNLMPAYLLQWHAIKWGRARGCRVYDMWGAPETEDENDPMAGLLRFKLGFGGRLRRGLGAWDYSPFPALYRAYRYAAPRLVGLRRRVRSRTQRYE